MLDQGMSGSNERELQKLSGLFRNGGHIENLKIIKDYYDFLRN